MAQPVKVSAAHAAKPDSLRSLGPTGSKERTSQPLHVLCVLHMCTPKEHGYRVQFGETSF